MGLGVLADGMSDPNDDRYVRVNDPNVVDPFDDLQVNPRKSSAV